MPVPMPTEIGKRQIIEALSPFSIFRPMTKFPRFASMSPYCSNGIDR